MRHLKRTAKLGRTGEHRNAMLANLVCSLIKHKRITTTLAKAKAARPVAEKMVTLGKKGTIHARRLVAARLHARGRSLGLTNAENKRWRNEEDVVHILFDQIAPVFKDRNGGYTRIIKAGIRASDASPMAIIEFVDRDTSAKGQDSGPVMTDEDFDEAAGEVVELVALGNVPVQRGGVELGEQVHPEHAGVDAVGDRHIHQAVLARAVQPTTTREKGASHIPDAVRPPEELGCTRSRCARKVELERVGAGRRVNLRL